MIRGRDDEKLQPRYDKTMFRHDGMKEGHRWKDTPDCYDAPKCETPSRDNDNCRQLRSGRRRCLLTLRTCADIAQMPAQRWFYKHRPAPKREIRRNFIVFGYGGSRAAIIPWTNVSPRHERFPSSLRTAIFQYHQQYYITSYVRTRCGRGTATVTVFYCQ